MSVSYGGDKITFEDGSTVSSGWAGFKNRIINGAMAIDQRNAGALVSGAAGNIYGVDRFNTGVFGSGTGRISAQQSNTVPSNSGFVKSLINTVTTADASPSQYYGYCLQQKIEGYNTADLMFGTANAKTITLSFWVRSSIVGTYVVTISNENTDRGYSATYTILEANTWEQKTITVVGDTTGTWYTTTNAGIILTWGLGGGTGRQAPSLNAWNSGAAGGYTITDASGCVDWIATSGATFLLTGVQLEKGSTASSFEWRPYTTELQLCQRYYCKTYQQTTVPGTATDTNCVFFALNGNCSYARTQWKFPVTMRTTPTVVGYNTNNGTAGQVSADASNYSGIVSSLGDSGFAFGVNNQLIGVDTYLKWQATASAEL
jgi:hypothetical protein